MRYVLTSWLFWGQWSMARQAVLLLTEWFYMVGWCTAANPLQCHWQKAGLMILGHFPQEGPTIKNMVFIWHEWLEDDVIENALHHHTNTCYIQSGPHLASAFLMWMHCSVWINLSCFRKAFWVLLSRDSTTHGYKSIVKTSFIWDVLPNGSLPFLFSFPCSPLATAEW